MQTPYSVCLALALQTVKNNWGATWGNKGYIYILKDGTSVFRPRRIIVLSPFYTLFCAIILLPVTVVSSLFTVWSNYIRFSRFMRDKKAQHYFERGRGQALGVRQALGVLACAASRCSRPTRPAAPHGFCRSTPRWRTSRRRPRRTTKRATNRPLVSRSQIAV